MTRLQTQVASVFGLAAVLVGCAGEEFDPFGRLTSLRVLAIQSEPVAPAPGETTTLTPLLYVPEGQSEPELSWSFCPFAGSGADGYPCEFDEEELGATDIDLGLPPADLGTEGTATLTNTVNPMVLSMICGGVDEAHAFLNCDKGFPAQIKLTVKTDKEEVTAVRTLHLRFEESQATNANPLLGGLEAKIDGEWLAVDEDFTSLLRRDEATELRGIVSEDQAETYPKPSDEVDGEFEDTRERLNIAWFVESGDTKFERTGFIEGVTDFDILRANEWMPARTEDYAEETAEIIMVVRDNREGTSWQRFTVGLTEEP